MSRILITGVAGFIGSHLAEYLINAGHEVHGIDNLSGGYFENVWDIGGGNCYLDPSGLADYENIEQIFDEVRPEYVYHLAAYAAEGLSPWIRRFNYENNLMGSMNIINLSIKHSVKRFIFASSIAVYGAHKGYMTEDVAPIPMDPYGIAKYAVELDLQAAQATHGLDYTIFRPHNVYGERQNMADPHRNVVGIFLREASQGKPVKVYGDGLQTRAFTYIKDIIPMMSMAMYNNQMRNEVFNIGADKTYTILELIEAMGISEYVHVPARHEAQATHPVHTKLKDIIRYPETPLSEGIAKVKAWYGTGVKYMKPRPAPEREI
jgi:UDP-glucose 4-epimerase